jgi:hypothetical protein
MTYNVICLTDIITVISGLLMSFGHPTESESLAPGHGHDLRLGCRTTSSTYDIVGPMIMMTYDVVGVRP